MTATDTPAATDTPLGDYAGKPVTKATIEIRGTGSGLEKGLHLPPIALVPGETYDVVLRCVADKHRHDLDDDGTFTLVNMLRAETCTVADPHDTVGDALDDAEAKVAERKAAELERRRAEKGEDPLPFPDDNGDRGGDPQTVGSVLDQALDLAEQAEHDADWRRDRTKELDGEAKNALLDIAHAYGLPGRSSMTKAELVDAIVDSEETAGGDV